MTNRTDFRAKFRVLFSLLVAAVFFAGTAQAAGHVSDTIRRETN